MLWFGIPTIILIGPPHALHTLTSTLNTRFEPLCGVAFRTAQPLAPARSQIRLVRPISLYISGGRFYLVGTWRRYAFSVTTVRSARCSGQYFMK